MTLQIEKFTQAIWSFNLQKEKLCKWKEFELGAVSPTSLIGQSCKVFWPLDDEWYIGVVGDYNDHTHKHLITYQDSEEEWIILAREQVKLKVSAAKRLWLSIATAQQSQDRRKRSNSVSCQYRGFWKWARARGSCVGQGERLPNVACYCNGWRACKSLWHVAYISWQCHRCPVFWELWSCKSWLQKCRAFLKRSVVQVALQIQKGGLSPRITGSRGVLKRV